MMTPSFTTEKATCLQWRLTAGGALVVFALLLLAGGLAHAQTHNADEIPGALRVLHAANVDTIVRLVQIHLTSYEHDQAQ